MHNKKCHGGSKKLAYDCYLVKTQFIVQISQLNISLVHLRNPNENGC